MLVFPKDLYWFIPLPELCKSSVSPYPHQHLCCLLVFVNLTILLGGHGISLGFWFSFPWWLMVWAPCHVFVSQWTSSVGTCLLESWDYFSFGLVTLLLICSFLYVLADFLSDFFLHWIKVVFSIFTVLCNHDHYPIPKPISITPKETPYLPILSFPHPLVTTNLSVLQICLFWTSYMNRIV